MLVHARLEGQEAGIGDVRTNTQNRLDTLNFAGRIWQIFRAIVSGLLHEPQNAPGCSVEAIMQVIGDTVTHFFVRSLQLNAFTLQLEYEWGRFYAVDFFASFNSET